MTQRFEAREQAGATGLGLDYIMTSSSKPCCLSNKAPKSKPYPRVSTRVRPVGILLLQSQITASERALEVIGRAGCGSSRVVSRALRHHTRQNAELNFYCSKF